MEIGDRLRIKRLEIKKTLEEVSKDVGISRQTLSRYETGIISNIPSDKIELLAKALDTTPAYIMGWEEMDQAIAKAYPFYNPGQGSFVEQLEKNPYERDMELFGSVLIGEDEFAKAFLRTFAKKSPSEWQRIRADMQTILNEANQEDAKKKQGL